MDNSKRFNEVVSKTRIPLLILDNKWHRIFGKMNPTEEIVTLQKELAKLVKMQGKLTNENKDLKKIKSDLMQGIVDNMDSDGYSDKAKEKALEDNKRLINETKERIEKNEDALLELPKEIERLNKELMLLTMDVCYERLHDNTAEIEEIAEWIKSVRIQLKKNIVKKQDLEIYNSELYSYMHDIFGPDVMELFDMKYVPTKHKLPEIKGNPDIKTDTDSDGNKFVE